MPEFSKSQSVRGSPRTLCDQKKWGIFRCHNWGSLIRHQHGLLHDIRNLSVGTIVDPVKAAEVINHLVPRTAHVRASMERGLKVIAHGIGTLLTDEERVRILMGLSEDEPNEIFRQKLTDHLNALSSSGELGLPMPVIERMAFVLAKENFATLAKDALPAIRTSFSKWLDTSDTLVREGHNEALARLSASTPRQKLYEGLTWSVCPAPQEGAILPDCVAIAIDHAGSAVPAMFIEWDELGAVIMPIAPDKLLIGKAPQCSVESFPEFNREAAKCSHDFFLAAERNEAFEGLHKRLGECAISLIEDGVNSAIEQFMPEPPLARDMDAPLLLPDVAGRSDEPWQYQLSLIGCGEQEDLQELIATLRRIVSSVAAALPLRRLDGITVAADYREAVISLDRGYDGASVPDATPEEIGQGIARTISVSRDSRWHERIILDASVAFALLADEAETVEWGLYILIRQLAEVSITEIIDQTLPDVWMQPIPDPLQGFLYQALHPSVIAYLSAHLSAGFGDPPDLANIKRDVLITALREMKSKGAAVRLEYRYHGNLDQLLAETMPLIRYVLQFAADLAGHCAAMGTEPFDSEGGLEGALEDAGLRHWFPIYWQRLERLRLDLGKWKSFDEFLALNVHVERLMWQLGLIPWAKGEGAHIEVPLGTDIAALIAAERDGQSGSGDVARI